MLEGKVITLVVTKEMVEAKSILDVAKAIYKISDTGIDGFQRVAISFYGYDNTSVELWEMPEVRAWCQKLVNKIPYIFYYIENEYFQTQQTLMICLNDYESVFLGQQKSPEEYYKEGVELEELPQHKIKIHVHRKSMHEMYKEIRKHAKELKKPQNAIKLISEMSQLYGISAE